MLFGPLYIHQQKGLKNHLTYTAGGNCISYYSVNHFLKNGISSSTNLLFLPYVPHVIMPHVINTIDTTLLFFLCLPCSDYIPVFILS